MPEDLRSTIEAAVAVEEAKPAAAPVVTPAPAAEPASDAAPVPPTAAIPEPVGATGAAAPAPGPTGATAPADPYEKPPQSWKTQVKGTWSTLPREVREEVTRREQNITRALSETAQARQLATQFNEVVRPYEARIRSMNMPPLAAVGELLKADHLLSTAPAPTKAQFMASLIQQYGVDIGMLDSVLAGQPTADPVTERVENLVQARLAPLQQFVQQQAMLAAQQQQAEAASMGQYLQAMAADSQKYPHFMAVKDTMADLLELGANRGQAMTVEQAYTRAVAMEGLSTQSTQQLAHDAAQRALLASSSVKGTDAVAPASKAAGSDLRATIEAAFASVGGR